MIRASRRRLLKLAGAGLVSAIAAPYITKASPFYPLGRIQPGLFYTSKKRSMVFVGASVNWNLGNDQTQGYVYYIQQQIDARMATPLGGWVPRYVHTDDIQPGGSCTSAPFNADAADEGPNWGTGSYSTASPLVFSNADGTVMSPVGHGSTAPINLNPTVGGTVGSAKLNTTDYPTQGNAGIFSAYTAASVGCLGAPPRGVYTNPMLRLDTAGQFIRFGVNNPRYLFLGVVGTGTVNIYSTWGGATPITLIGNAGSAITMFGIDFTLTSSSSTANIIYPAVAWGVPSMPPQGMSIYQASGRLDIALMWPGSLQASNHILCQICSRDSYCLQDYLGNDQSTAAPYYGTGTGTKITDLIAQGVLNSYQNFPSVCDPPIYVIFDSYNSIVTPGRQLTPSQYYTDLGTLASQLITSSGGSATIILTMPMPPNGASGFVPEAPYDYHDYNKQIRALAKAEGYGFVDQSIIPSLPSIYQNGNSQSSFWPDNIHPVGVGGGGNIPVTQSMARRFINAIGL